jgi:hypothetical protein
MKPKASKPSAFLLLDDITHLKDSISDFKTSFTSSLSEFKTDIEWLKKGVIGIYGTIGVLVLAQIISQFFK